MRHIDRGELREAIGLAADYELDLLRRHTEGTYDNGLFQDADSHVSFHSPFVTWQRMDAHQLNLPKEMLLTGVSLLLGLERASEEDRLVVMSLNLNQLERRISKDSSGPSMSSEHGLAMIAQLVVGQFGVVKSKRPRTIGDHRVWDMEVAPMLAGSEMRVMMLAHDGTVVIFLLASSDLERQSDEARLEELVKTTGFDFKPVNRTAIAPWITV